MSEVFLGVIAVATLVMALIQLGLVVGGIIAVKRVNEMLTRVEASAKPVYAAAKVGSFSMARLKYAVAFRRASPVR